MSFSSLSQNQSPIKFSSPDKISNFKTSPGQQEVILTNQPEDIIQLFNKKDLLLTKLLEDNKSLSSFIQQNDLNKLKQENLNLQAIISHKDDEIYKLKGQLKNASNRKKEDPSMNLLITHQKNPESVCIELPESPQSRLLDEQIKEFKSKIKELAKEIDKEKAKNEGLEVELKRKLLIEGINEEKLTLLSTEIQRLTGLLQEVRSHMSRMEEDNRVVRENEMALLRLKAGFEDRIKSLCAEMDKRDVKGKEDERNYKAAIENALKLLKVNEDRMKGLYDSLKDKTDKIELMEEKISILSQNQENIIKSQLIGQKQLFAGKFEEITKLYEVGQKRAQDIEKELKKKEDIIAELEKIIEEFRRINNENANYIKGREIEINHEKSSVEHMKKDEKIEELRLMLLKTEAHTNKCEEALLLARVENERLMRSIEDSHVHMNSSNRLLSSLEMDSLKKLIIDHYNAFLVLIRNNDGNAGVRSEASIQELREKLNFMIKEFNRILNDFASSQMILTENLKEKKGLEDIIMQKNKEIRENEGKVQEILAKNLVLNAEIIKISHFLKQKEIDYYAKIDEKTIEFNNNLHLANSEIDNLKSTLKYHRQETENLKKNNDHLMRYSGFESELLALKKEIEASEMKFIEKSKENELLKRKISENTEILLERTENTKKAALEKENHKLNELEIEIKFLKQENEHLIKIKQEQISQISQLKGAILDFDNEKTSYKMSITECNKKILMLEEENDKINNEHISKNSFEAQISQLKTKLDKLEHESNLKDYENETLRSNLKKYESLEKEADKAKELISEHEKEITLLRKRVFEGEEAQHELSMLNERFSLIDGKNKQLMKEIQEINEDRKILQQDLERTKDLHKNYNDLKEIIESLKGENNELSSLNYRFKEEMIRSNERMERIVEENTSLKEKNMEIDGYNRDNLKKIVEIERNHERISFENDKLKSLMYERLKEIETLKKKISEISAVYEVNVCSAKGKFEEIINAYLKEEKPKESCNNGERYVIERLKDLKNEHERARGSRHAGGSEDNRFDRILNELITYETKKNKTNYKDITLENQNEMKTEKKPSKKRTKSYIYEENVKKKKDFYCKNNYKIEFQMKDEEDISLLENTLKMLSLEMANLSQFKEMRSSEVKKLRMRILKVRQNLEDNVFVLEEKNLKYQDLLLQTSSLEKKIEKALMEERV